MQFMVYFVIYRYIYIKDSKLITMHINIQTYIILISFDPPYVPLDNQRWKYIHEFEYKDVQN